MKLETTTADLQRNQAHRIVAINPSLSCNSLKNKLKKKGIDTSIINEAVIFDADQEIENALLAIESKHKTIRAKMSPITLFDGHLFKLFDGKNSSLLMKK